MADDLMGEQVLPPSDRLLLQMHNLGIVHEKRGQTINELTQTTRIFSEELAEILRRHEESGYVRSIKDQQGLPRYFLTGKGIIRVSSTFT